MKKNILLTFLSIFIVTNISCANVQNGDLKEYVKKKHTKLNKPKDLKSLTKTMSNSRLVLLGESTHGTADYYYWRAEISKQLIKDYGYNFIAVEGDWASIYKLNLYVKGNSEKYANAREILKQFDRWPEWMWANKNIAELAEWLKKHNSNLPEHKKVGFYGMDVYGQWEAMDELLSFVSEYFPDKLNKFENKLDCFAKFNRDEWAYAQSLLSGASSCESELSILIESLKQLKEEFPSQQQYFYIKQNAYVVQGAENYFRNAVLDRSSSWNERVFYMFDTLKRLLGLYGDNSKAIVWAHNTHIGDSQYTDKKNQGNVNIGFLTREEFGEENVFLLGFSKFTGVVNAGSRWGDQMQLMNVPEAMEGSFDYLLNSIDVNSFYITFDETLRQNENLTKWGTHRAIGVMYNPQNESGNYVPTILTKRYDAIIFIKNTKPLQLIR